MVKRREFQRAYRFRFYPTPEQENPLRRTLGCARLVYNKALEARSEAWTSERRNVSYSDTSSMLTGWKKTDELSFLNDVSCVPCNRHCAISDALLSIRLFCSCRFGGVEHGQGESLRQVELGQLLSFQQLI